MGSDPQHVAYPGAEGSYTEEAAGRLYPSARQTSFATFDLVAAALVADEVDRGVLPIENSLAGLVPGHARDPRGGRRLGRRRGRAAHPALPDRARGRDAWRRSASCTRTRWRSRSAATRSTGATSASPRRRPPRPRARSRRSATSWSPRSRARSRPAATASRSSPRRSPTTPRTSRASSRWRASRGSTTTRTPSGTPRCG